MNNAQTAVICHSYRLKLFCTNLKLSQTTACHHFVSQRCYICLFNFQKSFIVCNSILVLLQFEMSKNSIGEKSNVVRLYSDGLGVKNDGSGITLLAECFVPSADAEEQVIRKR